VEIGVQCTKRAIAAARQPYPVTFGSPALLNFADATPGENAGPIILRAFRLQSRYPLVRKLPFFPSSTEKQRAR
jgi:hypothetical protein